MAERRLTPAQQMQKQLAEMFKKFAKTPFAIPAAIGASLLVYYLFIAVVSAPCLMGLLPPLTLLAFLWWFDVKSAKKLLYIGVVATFCVIAVSTAWYTSYFMSVDPPLAESEDLTITDGTVTPLRGDSSTVYNFTMTVHCNSTAVIEEANFTVVPFTSSLVSVPEIVTIDMTLLDGDDSEAHFYYETTVNHSINWYLFEVKVDGEEHSAFSLGPIFEDTGAVASPLLVASIMQGFLQYLLIYVLIVGMIWWTRRARVMREKRIEKWEAARRQEEAEKGKEETKVPSLQQAMGLETGAEGGFVCSECGADVPADATVCPKCGEKFE